MHKCINNSVGNIYHLEQFVSDFFPYSQKQLGFDKPATIRFESDQDNAEAMLGKTAYYDPAAMEVVLYVDGRHPKDVMRSLSHELVHHAQNCRGDFTGQDNTGAGYAQEDPHLRKMEREAYTKGNLIFRDFEDLIKTGKINIEIDFSDSGEPKMSLKEWKNNEINTKLMKKWGLLKESYTLYDDVGDYYDEYESVEELKKDLANLAQRTDTEDWIVEDPNGKKIELGERLELDEKFPTRGPSRGGTMPVIPQDEQGDDAGLQRNADLPPGNMELDRRAMAAANKGAQGGDSKRKKPLFAKGGGNVAGASGKVRTAYGENKKISVREAKEITRRIIERIRKEGK
jgi:hypothetical protein